MSDPERGVARLTPSARISAVAPLHGLLMRIAMSLDAGCDAVRSQYELRGQLLDSGSIDCERAHDFLGCSSRFEFIETFYAFNSGGIRPAAITPDLLGRSCSL